MTSPHDPFAPAVPEFPRERLTRIGLDPDVVDALEDRYDDMPDGRAAEWVAEIRAQSNTTVRGRFTVPDGDRAEVAAALEGLQQPALRDLAAAEGLPVSGTNEELRERILVAEFGEDTPAPSGSAPAPEEPPQEPTPPAAAPPPAEEPAAEEPPPAPPAVGRRASARHRA